MKKSIMGVLTLLWVSMIVLGGCSSSPKEKTFSLENPQKITVTSISGEKIEIIDEDIKQKITDNITSIQFERGESSEDTNGFGPFISWYNSNGDVLETISVMSNDTIIYDNYFWTAINGSIDMEVINATLSTNTSLLDGVTMEVTECSDTSVTVRIVNDTDKDIQCGEEFYLEIQDEETGEWREADTVIDDAAFDGIAYVIQKDFPYEKDINFEWLYGKLEPGIYRIVKTVTDFRGTGDYTDYVLTAEFSINELTMEILLELYENDALTLKVEEEGLEGFLAYGNMKPLSGTEDSLTGLYICDLVYPHTFDNGITSDRNYELQLSYWRPETAEEYGHTENEIDNIRLMEKESQDAVLLYEVDERFTPTKDLRGFLQRDYGMDQYLICELPNDFTLIEYREDIGFCGGWLLEGETEESPHDEGILEAWYCPGGIGRGEAASQILQFESGVLTDAVLMMNHTEQLGETEILEGCEVQAVYIYNWI